MAIDELNNLTHEKSDFYAEYFGVMELPDEEIEERIDLANKLESSFFFILALILADSKNEEIQSNEYYTDILFSSYRNAVVDFYGEEITEDSYLDLLASRQSQVIVDETILRIADDYYTSENRAMNISANESNSVANYHRELEMIKQGKTQKQWKTRMDGRERKEHKLANGQIVGIFEPFIVGGEKLMFPTDRSLGASDKNIIGCRCVAEYF